MAIKASKIRNSLGKGRLWVIYKGKEFEVIELFSKRVLIKNSNGDRYTTSVQEVSFKEFIKRKSA